MILATLFLVLSFASFSIAIISHYSLNWFLKQIFYIRFLIFKCGDIKPIVKTDWKFESVSFTVFNWNKYLPWYRESEDEQDWNTYNKFYQRYGRFYFRCMLDVEVIPDIQWPAIWLLELRSKTDNTPDLLKFNGLEYYYEIDIELFHDSMGYTIHINHIGGQHEYGYHDMHIKFHNKRLYRKLSTEYHLYLIDWQWDYIRFYIDGIITAKFRNEIHLPMQIVMSNLSMNWVAVEQNY
jgi:beta-glucanase (GH16 family)